jgi:hypothetical protein
VSFLRPCGVLFWLRQNQRDDRDDDVRVLQERVDRTCSRRRGGGLWPSDFAQERTPESLALTVAFFSILVYVGAQFPTVGQIMRIADRYFNAGKTARPHLAVSRL